MASFPGAIVSLSLEESVGESTARLLDTSVFAGQQSQGMDTVAEEVGFQLPALTPLAGTKMVSGFPGAPAFKALQRGELHDEQNAGEDWFEKIHAKPRAINLGTVITVQLYTIELFNADRRLNHALTSFVDAAGPGISIIDMPSLPYTLLYLTSLLLTLEVTPDGPAIIDGDIIFIFDLGEVHVPLTGIRVLLFPFVPEVPVVETLRWLTDVHQHIDGSEQRIRVRKRPRQEFAMTFALDGAERQALNSMLFDVQGGFTGLPIWTEPVFLTAAVTAGGTVLPVTSTAFSDIRVGSLVVAFIDRVTFDAINVASFNDTSITLAGALTNGYPIGTRVMPVRTVLVPKQASSRKAPVKSQSIELVFRVTDNDVDLADAGAFSTLLGKVLLDDPNLIDRELSEAYLVRAYDFDSEAGLFSQLAAWERNKHAQQKGFFTNTRQKLWELRGLLHALAGKLTPFYIPTFFDDLTVQSTLTSGSLLMEIDAVGFTAFVQERKGLLRIHLSNGTVLTRNVVGSAEIDDDTEQLTLDLVWPSTILASDVERVEYVELVRLDTDEVSIQHLNSRGEASAFAPVVEVFE